MSNDEQGQSLVETALLLPVLLLLVAAIFDFGRIFYFSIHLQLAAQETVRLGGLGKTDSEITSFAENYFHGDTSKLSVAISPTDNLRRSGEYVTVQFDYPAPIVTPLLSNVLSDKLTLTAESTIRVE